MKPYEHLLQHPRRGEIQFDERLNCFVRCEEDRNSSKRAANDVTIKRRRLRGLRELLTEVFWPKYSYEEAKEVATRYRASANAGAEFEGGKMVRFSSQQAASEYGLTRGKVVHAQIEDFVRHSEKKFRRLHPLVHPFTHAVIEIVQNDLGLSFLSAEEPVYSEEGQFATALDQVCVDQEGRLVLIELKCGMERYALHGNRSMDKSLKGVRSNCPLNQAFVQLLVSSMMLQRMYQVDVHAAYVILAQEDGATPYAIPKDILERRDDIYADLCDYARRTLEDPSIRKRLRRRNGMLSLKGQRLGWKRRRRTRKQRKNLPSL